MSSLSYLDIYRRLTSNLADFQRTADAVREAMVWVLNSSGELLTMNAAGQRHLGLPLEVLTQIDRTVLVHPDDRVTLQVARWYLTTHRRNVTGLYRVWCTEGGYRRMVCDAAPVANPETGAVAYLAAAVSYSATRRRPPNTHKLFVKLLGLDHEESLPGHAVTQRRPNIIPAIFSRVSPPARSGRRH